MTAMAAVVPSAVDDLATARPARIRTPWLFSARADLVAFVFAPMLAFALLGLAPLLGIGLRGSTPTWAWIACVVMVDVAHVHSTVFRVYLDTAEVRRRPMLYLGTPVMAYSLGVLVHRTFGALGFWRTLAYLAVWHFVRQQVGWVALYRARGGERGDLARKLDAWLDPAAIYAATLYPLLAWHARLPRRISWFVAGDFVHGVPQLAASIAKPVWLALLVLFVARQLQLGIDRRGVNLGKVLVVLGTYATWWVGIVVCDSDYAFTVTNVLPHGIAYFVLIAAYSRRRYADRSAAPAKLASSLLRFGFGAAFAVLVLFSFAEEGLWDRFVWHDHERLFGEGHVLSTRALAFLVPLLALPQAVHYVLDGAIWKRRGNPTLSRYL